MTNHFLMFEPDCLGHQEWFVDLVLSASDWQRQTYNIFYIGLVAVLLFCLFIDSLSISALLVILCVACLAIFGYVFRPFLRHQGTRLVCTPSGHWMICEQGQWQRFYCERLHYMNPLWFVIQGRSQHPMYCNPHQFTSKSFVIWKDSVTPDNWRSLSMACIWIKSRSEV